ncbi:hypothetical protein [Mycolicibacterium hodleri]|uniref:hypothetical protein n=1 Tax=Mycolicibacterium hodleri TaxID=49897 RepID=UPI0011284E89|nr:hypothetical protein [Mycolicibacterium hodleri]
MAADLSGTYTDFWTVTQGALEFAARKTGLELTTAGRERLALLSNATAMMLDAWVQNSDRAACSTLT